MPAVPGFRSQARKEEKYEALINIGVEEKKQNRRTGIGENK